MHNFTLQLSVPREQRPPRLRIRFFNNPFRWFRTNIPTQTVTLSDPKALCLEKNT